MTLRIHWFSPLPPAETDIANYAVPVLHELAKNHEVIVWYEEGAATPPAWVLPAGCFTRPYQQSHTAYSTLNNGVPIYHIGNNSQFHRWIHQVACTVPGIVVVHEPNLASLALGSTPSVDRHIDLCETYHGAEAGRAARSYWTNGMDFLELGQIAPLTEWAIGQALAAVIHWSGVRHWLDDVHGLPIRHIDLAFSPTTAAPTRPRGPLAQPVQLVVAGFLGQNRQLDVTFEALAGLAERESFVLNVAGVVMDPALVELPRQLGIEHLVQWHGQLSPADLDVLLDRMDLAVNLRYPTMGETSGSQLRFWSRRLPTIASHIGWYGDQDPTTVAFVPPTPRDDAVVALRDHFRSYLHDPEPYRDLGDRGYRTLIQRHHAAGYAAALADLAAEASSLRIRWSANTMADRAADTVRPWIGKDGTGVADVVLERFDRAVARLLAP